MRATESRIFRRGAFHRIVSTIKVLSNVLCVLAYMNVLMLEDDSTSPVTEKEVLTEWPDNFLRFLIIAHHNTDG